MADERIDLTFTGDSSDAQLSVDVIDRILEKLERQVEQLVRELRRIEITPRQVAQTVAGSKAMERAIEEVGDEADRTERKLSAMVRQFGPAATAGLIRNNPALFGGGGTTRQTFPFGPAPSGGAGARGGFFGTLFGAALGGAAGGGGRGGGGLDVRDLTLFDELFRGVLPGGGRARTGGVVTGALLGGAGAAALSPATLGLTPALFGGLTALAAQITVLKTAFSGLGDAIGGDKEAFDELDATSQAFVQRVRGFIPHFEEFRQSIKDIILPDVAQALDIALNQRTLSQVEGGMRGVAEAIGQASIEWASWLGSADVGNRLERILGRSAGWTEDWSDTLLALADAILVVTDAGGPLLDWMADGIRQGAEWLDTWIRGKEATGELGAALEGSKDEIRLVGDLIGALAEVAFRLGQVLKPLGDEILADLVEVLRDLGGWLQRNREEIAENLIGAYEGLVNVISTLWPIVLDLANAVLDVVDAFGGMEVAVTFLLAGQLTIAIVRAAQALTLSLIPALGRTRAAIIGTGLGALLIAATELGLLSGAFGGGGDTPPTGRATFPGPFTAKAGAGGVPKGAQVKEVYAEDGRWYIVWLREKKGGRGPATFVVEEVTEVTLAQAAAIMGRTPKQLRTLITAGDRIAPADQAVGGGKTLPQGPFTGSGHFTSGIPGQPARDISYEPGQAVGAPDDGLIVSVKMNARQDFKAGFGGWSIRLRDAVGGEYFITHVFRPQVKPGQRVTRGQVLGYVDKKVGSAFHVHIGYSPGVATPTRPRTGSGDDTVRTTAPPFEVDKPEPPTLAERQRDRLANIRLAVESADITPGIRDDIRARRRGIGILRALIPDVKDPQLRLEIKRQIKSWQDEVNRLVEELPIGKAAMKQLRGQFVDVIGDFKGLPKEVRSALAPEMRELRELWAEILVGGITKAERKELRKAMADFRRAAKQELQRFRADLADQFRDLAGDLVAAFFDAFDEETRKHKTPTELLIEQLTDEDEGRRLQEAVDDARKRLEEALRGSAPDTNDAVREIVGRFKLARSVELAQLAVLGGGAGSGLIDSLLQELGDALDVSNVIDPDEVADATKDLEEALFDQRMFFLEKQADAEREAYEAERAAQREHLGILLNMWIAFYAALIASGRIGLGQAAGEFLTVVNTVLAAFGLPPITMPGAPKLDTAVLPPGIPLPPGVGIDFTGGGAGGGSVKAMAAGGVLSRGVVFGDGGPELVTPLPINWREMQAGMLYGRGEAAPVYVDVVLEPDMAGLERFVRVKMVRNRDALSSALGADADLRARSGRY